MVCWRIQNAYLHAAAASVSLRIAANHLLIHSTLLQTMFFVLAFFFAPATNREKKEDLNCAICAAV